jgi:hypothetical protein
MQQGAAQGAKSKAAQLPQKQILLHSLPPSFSSKKDTPLSPLLFVRGNAMNPYLQHLRKIEFAITDACTGRCRHCSQGEHPSTGISFPPALAAEVTRRVNRSYPLQTAMTFGGEPLLYPETVYAVMRAAREEGIPHRQVITNGCFTADPQHRREVAKRLKDCGVNDLLLSVDVFHQETLPLDAVKAFAEDCLEHRLPLRLQPAWMEGPEGNNPFDAATRKLLAAFAPLGIKVGEGNRVFPEGRAKHLPQEYFSLPRENPYREDPEHITCLSVEPNGNLLHSNINQEDVLQILESYRPPTMNKGDLL